MTGLARAVAGHLCGLVCSVGVAAFGPRIMDLLVCLVGSLKLVHVDGDFCTAGSARLGEGGIVLSWAGAASLLGLVVIMETLFWLGRWYRVRAWWGVVALVISCPALLAAIVLTTGEGVGTAALVGLIIGTPVALASSAYWVTLALWRTRVTSA